MKHDNITHEQYSTPWRNPRFCGPFLILFVLLALLTAAFILPKCLPIHSYILKSAQRPTAPVVKRSMWKRDKSWMRTSSQGLDSWEGLTVYQCQKVPPEPLLSFSNTPSAVPSTPSAVWHPSRASHLTWSFASPSPRAPSDASRKGLPRRPGAAGRQALVPAEAVTLEMTKRV
jgi:hypothetical protein